MEQELDYSRGAKPLYAQLYDILLEKLKTGEYRKNDVLPTEAEFEEMFGVSRITARRALAELVAKGLVKRQAGIGTMVISTSEKQSVKTRISLIDGQQTEAIARNNLSLTPVQPPAPVAQLFDADSALLLTRTIYRQNEEPAQVNYIYLTPRLNAQVNYIYLTPRLNALTLSDLEKGLYCALEQHNENIDAFEDIITAELPTPEDCEILGVVPSVPLLVKTRKGYNEQGQLVEYTIAKHIARYYQYIVENSK